MRLGLPSCFTACALALAACGPSLDDGGDGAAYEGVDIELTSQPSVMIDDEFGTEVRVFVELTHRGGPTAETFEIVAASLGLDLEPYADIALAIPEDHAGFVGLAEGETVTLELRGTIPDNHDDWGLCVGPQDEEARVSLDLELHISPGANDGLDEFVFESLAVDLGCSHTG